MEGQYHIFPGRAVLLPDWSTCASHVISEDALDLLGDPCRCSPGEQCQVGFMVYCPSIKNGLLWKLCFFYMFFAIYMYIYIWIIHIYIYSKIHIKNTVFITGRSLWKASIEIKSPGLACARPCAEGLCNCEQLYYYYLCII